MKRYFLLIILLLLTLNVVAQSCAKIIVTNTSYTNNKSTSVEVYDISGKPLNPKTITCYFENNGANGKPMYCDVTQYNPPPAYYLYKTCTGQSHNCKLCLYNAQGELVEGGALSVNIVDFNVEKSNIGNIITWTTQREKNIDFFLLKRLDNDKWVEVAREKAFNDDKTNSYSVVDRSYNINSLNYYQLSDVDFNGQVKPIQTITVDNRSNKNLNIVGVYDLFGNVVDENYKGMVIVKYEDGSSIKTFQ